MEYKTNRHACYLLQYHIVLVTKYRHPILKGELKEYIYSLIQKQLAQRKIELIAMNGEPDHIHMIVDMPPHIAPADLVNVLKTNTSRLARRDYSNEVNKYYWKDVFWSPSYFVCTVSEHSLSIVKQYIEAQ